MDLERAGHGRLHVALGPVEKWVVGIVASLAVGAVLWFANSVLVRLDAQASQSQAQSERMAKIETQQAVTNQQLATLNLQLADVPSLNRQMAELKVRVDNHDESIREVRQMRGLR